MSSFRSKFQVLHQLLDHSEEMEEMGIKHLTSYANIEDDNTAGRLFTKMRNKSGPRMLPCGMPEMTGKVFETDRPTDTYCTLLVR